MWEAIVNFFKAPPPALDPIFVTWVTEFIAGSMITIAAVWALLKYIAKITPWAADDKIVQIISGAFGAVKDAVKPLRERGRDT